MRKKALLFVMIRGKIKYKVVIRRIFSRLLFDIRDNKRFMVDKNKCNIIVLIFRDSLTAMCDYMLQTAKNLNNSQFVVTFLIHETISWRTIFTKKIAEKNSLGIVIRPFMFIPFCRFQRIYTCNILINLFCITFFVTLYQKFYIKKNSHLYLYVFKPVDYYICAIFSPFYRIVYDCVDYFTAREFINYQQLLKLQTQLIQKAYLCVTISTPIFCKFKEINNKTILAPCGFSSEDFVSSIKHSKEKFEPITVGYVGELNWRIDYNLLLAVTKALPEIKFEFIGPVNTSMQNIDKHIVNHNIVNLIQKMEQLPNVHIIDKKMSRRELSKYLSNFDIGIIPYDTKLEFNKYCNPMKTYEYLFFHLPIISTQIDHLNTVKHIYASNKNPEWIKKINQINTDRYQLSKYELRDFALQNSWTNKVNELFKTLCIET